MALPLLPHSQNVGFPSLQDLCLRELLKEDASVFIEKTHPLFTSLLSKWEPLTKKIIPPLEPDLDPLQKVTQIYRAVMDRAKETPELAPYLDCSVPFITQKIQKMDQEENFLLFFDLVLETNFIEEHLVLKGNTTEQVAIAQNWMRSHSALLERIETLNLNSLFLTELPSEIHYFTNLKKLELDSPRINTLPEGFNPPLLEKLYLKGTKIQNLPESFNPLLLEELSLYHSLIQCLPENFNPPRLKRLSLAFSQIQQLPEGFNPPQLRWLNIMGTPIQRLPENFNPPLLEELHFGPSQIQRLPENFNPPQLKWLDLSYSQIQELPLSFNPPLLEHLDLRGTPIADLWNREGVPQKFRRAGLTIFTQS